MTNGFVGSALWGNLLTDPDVASEFSADAMIGYFVRFEKAWTDALCAANKIDAATAERACSLIDAFAPDFADMAQGTMKDGLPVPAFVRQLRGTAPEDVRAAIHTGATSQDVIDTAMVLACLKVVGILAARVEKIQATLTALDADFGALPMMGRTRMQAALPITVGDRVGLWQRALDDHLDVLPDLVARFGQVQVGGPVGVRSDDVIARSVAQELGLAVTPVWHTNRSSMVDLGHWLTKLAGTCAKLGKDITLMAQQGIQEVQLDGAGGSSAMPHKQNPVRGEVVIALGRFVAGQQAILAQSMIHEQERSGESWTMEWLTLPTMLEATGASLNATGDLLGQVRQMARAT